MYQSLSSLRIQTVIQIQSFHQWESMTIALVQDKEENKTLANGKASMDFPKKIEKGLIDKDMWVH